MKHEQTQKSAMLPRASKTAGNTCRQMAKACLATVDWYHRTSLHAKQGERAVAPTKRITFSEQLRRKISAKQRHLCMYCGVALLRLNRNRRHIDHKIPVEHGGSNEESNLQALCNKCNSTKGVQTDEEFRERYSELLGNTRPGQPPERRIEQAHFKAVTRLTSQLDSTIARRKAIFKTPFQKISAASAVPATVLAVVWFLALPLNLHGQARAAGTLAFIGAPVAFSPYLVGLDVASKSHGNTDVKEPVRTAPPSLGQQAETKAQRRARAVHHPPDGVRPLKPLRTKEDTSHATACLQ